MLFDVRRFIPGLPPYDHSLESLMVYLIDNMWQPI